MKHPEKICFPELSGKTPEEIFEGLSLFLLRAAAADILESGPALAEIIPQLKPLLGFDQRSPHHAYDLFTHVAYVVEKVPRDLTLRWAALLHDIGKIPTFTRDETGRGHFYGHAQAGARMAAEVLAGLKAPEFLREQVPVLIEKHMTKLKPEEAEVRQQVNALGWNTVNNLLYLQEADMTSKGVDEPLTLEQFPQLRILLNQIGANEP